MGGDGHMVQVHGWQLAHGASGFNYRAIACASAQIARQMLLGHVWRHGLTLANFVLVQPEQAHGEPWCAKTAL